MKSVAFGLTKALKNDLSYLSSKYNSPECDKYMKARNNIDATKGVLVESMEKLLERGE